MRLCVYVSDWLGIVFLFSLKIAADRNREVAVDLADAKTREHNQHASLVGSTEFESLASPASRAALQRPTGTQMGLPHAVLPL